MSGLLVIILVLIIGGVYGFKYINSDKQSYSVLSEETSKENNLNNDTDVTLPTSPTQAPSSTPFPTKTVDISPTSNPLVSSDFQYPGSVRVSGDSDTERYESTSSVDEVTNWYQEKIRSIGLNTRTFVRTNTNGKILNKLAASSNSMEIEIEISKESNENIVKISVKIGKSV